MPVGKYEQLVIIPCGGKKQSSRCQAQVMYIGSYHKLCQAYARTLTSPRNILILSALHGLLSLTEEIEPYDLRMGQRGCVQTEDVWEQVIGRGLAYHLVTALGGRAYTEICRTIWRDRCERPLSGVGGIGKQMQWLRRRIDDALDH